MNTHTHLHTQEILIGHEHPDLPSPPNDHTHTCARVQVDKPGPSTECLQEARLLGRHKHDLSRLRFVNDNSEA